MFQNWFSSSNRSTFCIFQNLQLTKISDILTHLIFDKQLSLTNNLTTNQTISIDQFIEDLTQQTISTAQAIAQRYQEKVNDEKQKIINNRERLKKKPPGVHAIITAIENRQRNTIERAQYMLEEQIKSLFVN